MEISTASFEGGAEVDCGRHGNGIDDYFRVTIRQVEDVFEVYRYEILPDSGNTIVLTEGTLEECARLVTEKFGFKVEVVKTFKCEACLPPCIRSVRNSPETNPTECYRGIKDSYFVKWTEVVA